MSKGGEPQAGQPGPYAEDPHHGGSGVTSRNDILLLALILLPVLGILLWLSEADYLFFHVLVEFVSIVIGYCIFAFTITSRKILDGYLVIIGVGYFFFGTIDLLHTLTFKGMGIMAQDADLATQLWIIARYGQATTFVAAALWVGRKVHAGRLFLLMAAITATMVSLAFMGLFPACYVEGVGLTPFKVASEYVICIMLAAAMVIFYSRRSMLDQRVMHLLLASIAFSIAAEVSFTSYVSVYDIFNALGHLLRLVSVLLIYIAIVEMAVSRPVASLFKQLSDSEKRYRTLLEVTPSLVVVFDEKGRIENCNRRVAEAVTGGNSVSMEEARNAFDEGQLRSGLEQTRADGRAAFRADVITPAGRRAILWNAAVESLGDEHLVVMSGLDITERERDRERIEDLNDFFYILNRITMHDLRNRLMEVNGYLRRYQKKGNPEDLNLAAENANAGAETLRRLELLSRSVQARPEPVSWDLREVSQTVARQSVEKERVSVVGECHALVDDAFASVLENIVSNAFRHGRADKVLISLAEDEEKATVTISDNGTGIPDEIKEKVFTSGYSHGSTGNTGMGLFIARKIVESYGGSIRVEDNHPSGAVFIIQLSCGNEAAVGEE